MQNDKAQMTARPSQPNWLPTPAAWDATKREAPVELLERGFQLAYLLVLDRSVAIDILVRALEKLRVRSRREIKRLYWRDKHAERPVRRMVRNDTDMLQWLIMFESEEIEKAEERAGSAALRDMVIRYTKHTVQVTTALSAFYVNVGITRLLHSYNTSQAQQVYEMLTCRYLGPDEYRRAKATLMDKINERFGGFVRKTRVEHGELRFETLSDQERWAALVDECLRAFAPWSTQGYCSRFLAVTAGNNVEAAHGAADTDQNEMEMKCCHILIEPTCYSRWLSMLGLDPPDMNLAIPRFVMPDKQEKNGDDASQRQRAPGLSQDELDQIQRRLAVSDARRRSMNPSSVTVVVDGVEYAHLDLAQKRGLQIEVKAGASLIEVRGRDDRGEVLLATHVISYANNVFELSRGTATLSRGRLRFAIKPTPDSPDRAPQAILSLHYSPRFQWVRPWAMGSILESSQRAIRWYALTGLAVALISWGAASLFYGYKIKTLENKLQQAQGHPHQLVPATARAIMSYTLTRDDLRVRSVDGAGIPEISLRPHSAAISLALPVSPAAAQGYSAELNTFAGDRTLLTLNFLQATRTNAASIVEIVVPSDLLRADTYYTVHLRSTGATDHFTFKVVSGE
jgi:hypothetical protein